jgi:chromosome partitioning protein
MITWTVANQKGGVGKTTTSVSLAGHLSQQGKRVLMVDMDPHGSLSVYFHFDPDEVNHGVYALFQQAAENQPLQVPLQIKETRSNGIDLLCASTAQATLDRQLGSREGMGLVMGKVLQQIQTDYDYVIIDCSPSLGILMVNALAVCDRLIIPVQSEFLALKGLERLLHTLAMINRARKNELPYVIVPTMYDKRTRASREALQQLRRKYAENLWEGVIPVDTRFREASRMGVPINLLQASSRGALAYGQLLNYLQTGKRQNSNVIRVMS